MITFLISAVVASIFAPVSDSSAYTHTDSNPSTGYYVTLSASDEVKLSVDATPVGQMVAAQDTINVKTNSPTGYKLYINTSSSDLVSSDTSNTYKFASTSGTISSPTTLANNTWGFSLTSPGSLPIPPTSSTWSAVPLYDTKIAESSIATTDTGMDTPIYYAINADTTMPDGTYSTTITYTAIADGTLTNTMQDFTITDCANLDTDSSVYLADSRNNKVYRIVKARDGNCWMADNLSIYNQTISSADSNLPEGTTITLPASTTWNTNDTTNMRIHVADGTGSYADKTGAYYGEVYYNWCASIGETNCSKYNVAGTTINQSICPKGWRLPINGDASQSLSYAKLMNAYGVSTGADLVDSTPYQVIHTLGFDKYYGLWSLGYVSEYNQGTNGYFWSSTAYSDAVAYYLSYNSATISSQANANKGNGYSIRCVQENRTMSNVTYMQDVYDQICANTATGATAQLLDKRGQGNKGTNTTAKYGVLKAKDGNCWMTSNLNLYNKALTPNDTDIPSNITLPASTNWTTNDNTNLRIHVANGTGNYADKTGKYYGEVYYNWCASIGKTNCTDVGTVNQSICPKNWRLPINGDATTDKSYAKLMSVYGVTTGAQLMNSSYTGYVLGFRKYYGAWWQAQSSEKFQGAYGSFWSSTAGSKTGAYGHDYTSTTIDPQDPDDKGDGDSARCVLR